MTASEWTPKVQRVAHQAISSVTLKAPQWGNWAVCYFLKPSHPSFLSVWPLCPLSKAMRGGCGPETVTVAQINPTRRPVIKQASTLGLSQSREGEDKETQCQGMAVISWLQACHVSTQPRLRDLMQKQFESAGQRDASAASSPVASLNAGRVPQVNIDWLLRFFSCWCRWKKGALIHEMKRNQCNVNVHNRRMRWFIRCDATLSQTRLSLQPNNLTPLVEHAKLNLMLHFWAHQHNGLRMTWSKMHNDAGVPVELGHTGASSHANNLYFQCLVQSSLITPFFHLQTLTLIFTPTDNL